MMDADLTLRRKWTFRAHGKQVVLVKRPNERAAHVFMKALVWCLYLPDYPNLAIELAVGDRYKPDVVELGAWGEPRFWGEAGQVGIEKIHSLARRYPTTHFAIAKWGVPFDPFVRLVAAALDGLERRAPFDLLCFPADSAERFIDGRGRVAVMHGDIEWLRLR